MVLMLVIFLLLNLFSLFLNFDYFDFGGECSEYIDFPEIEKRVYSRAIIV